MILVSACLLGVDCRYDGKSSNNNEITEFLRDKQYVPVCPEQLGGLTTPRKPSEIVCGDGNSVLNGESRVINNIKQDVTKEFIKGAEETLKIAEMFHCEIAILKAKSPSCGSKNIYNGEFNGKIKEGIGVTVAILMDKGIKVLNEENYKEYSKH